MASIENLMEEKVTNDDQTLELNGRSIARYSISELLQLREIYKREAFKESDDLSSSFMRRVDSAFNESRKATEAEMKHATPIVQ